MNVEKLSRSKNDLGRKNLKNNNSSSSCCIFFLSSCCLAPHSFGVSSSEHCHTTPALTQTHPRPQPGSVCLPSLNFYIFSSTSQFLMAWKKNKMKEYPSACPSSFSVWDHRGLWPWCAPWLFHDLPMELCGWSNARIQHWGFIQYSRPTPAGFWCRWSWGLLVLSSPNLSAPCRWRCKKKKNAQSLTNSSARSWKLWHGLGRDLSFPPSSRQSCEITLGPSPHPRGTKIGYFCQTRDAPGFPSLMSLDGSSCSCPHLKHFGWKWIPIQQPLNNWNFSCCTLLHMLNAFNHKKSSCMENTWILWAGLHDSSESKKLWLYPTIPGNFFFRIHRNT